MTGQPSGFKRMLFNKRFRKRTLHLSKKHLPPSPTILPQLLGGGAVGLSRGGGGVKILLAHAQRAQLHPTRMKSALLPLQRWQLPPAQVLGRRVIPSLPDSSSEI